MDDRGGGLFLGGAGGGVVGGVLLGGEEVTEGREISGVDLLFERGV